MGVLLRLVPRPDSDRDVRAPSLAATVPGASREPVTAEADVHFVCLARDVWSIHDRRLDARAPESRLGWLHRVAGVFEIRFGDSERPPVHCESLAAARLEFVEPVAARPALRVV